MRATLQVFWKDYLEQKTALLKWVQRLSNKRTPKHRGLGGLGLVMPSFFLFFRFQQGNHKAPKGAVGLQGCLPHVGTWPEQCFRGAAWGPFLLAGVVFYLGKWETETETFEVKWLKWDAWMTVDVEKKSSFFDNWTGRNKFWAGCGSRIFWLPERQKVATLNSWEEIFLRQQQKGRELASFLVEELVQHVAGKVRQGHEWGKAFWRFLSILLWWWLWWPLFNISQVTT